jgi:hypothetical protein
MHNVFAQTLNNIHHKGRTWAEMFKYRVLRKIFGTKREEVTTVFARVISALVYFVDPNF